MYLNDLLIEKQMSRYRPAKESGVPKTTIADICSGKAQIEKCSAGTLYKIAKTMGVSMESFIEGQMADHFVKRRVSFEVFKSNVCHLLKEQGDIDFIINILEADEIRKLYEKNGIRRHFTFWP